MFAVDQSRGKLNSRRGPADSARRADFDVSALGGYGGRLGPRV